MLAFLSEWVTRWDEATRTPIWRWSGVAAGLVVAGVMLASSPPTGMSTASWHTAAVAVVMAAWWVMQVLPMAVTGLVPLIAFPLLGLASPGQVAAPYAHPLIFLMLGGFLIAAGMGRVGLHVRLTAWLLRPEVVRRSPRRMVLALMVVSALLSGFVSNTATTVMMLPLALSLASQVGDDARTRSVFVLGLAYAASLGGMTTLVGTPPNAVFAGIASDQGIDAGFGMWMVLGVPTAAVGVALAWWVLTGVAYTLPEKTSGFEAPESPPWKVEEVVVLGILGVALVAWLTRAPLAIGSSVFFGWGAGLGWKGSECDALVALTAGATMFTVPRRVDGRWALLLDWRTTERSVPWSVILLLGGGFALAGQISASGLTAWVASGATALADLPLPVTVLGVCIGMTLLTELTSNTASTQVALPLLAAAAETAGVDPLMWMVPATFSASCAFMMPVATPPNAIATEGGGVSPADLALAGMILNPILAVAITCISLVLVPWVFG